MAWGGVRRDLSPTAARLGVLAWGAVAATVGTVIVSTQPSAPLALWNTTPSEPEGLYLRRGGPPKVGRIIAFRLPEAGLAYAGASMPYLRSRSLLKSIAAGPGDMVCAGPQGLAINGFQVAPVAAHDRQGRPLPHWQECRRLLANEVFVFSSRVPNSFDSRYFGPVRRSDIIGVYAPVRMTRGEGA